MKAGNGVFSHGAVFAFYPNKQITTGEGGMIVTDDDRIARLCRSMSNQGRGEAGVWPCHQRLGHKCPMERRTRTPSNVSAAVWCRAPKLCGIQPAPSFASSVSS
ncbi:MAG: DegT/DnrJ/EryC1/StrS family aminotransferase [Firmicutes bacterium]|nr:DegT/DnrJ/EryC1/StrS family aminotransferase [Bacillota bacterium]